MTIFWITLVSVFILGYMAQLSRQSVVIDDQLVARPNRILISISCMILVLVSGLRSNIGDTPVYIQIFNALPNTVGEFLSSKGNLFQDDNGFYLIVTFIKQFISNDPQVFIFIMALITNVLIVVILYKYSIAIEMSLFLYITTGIYLITMNGVRQYLASAIVFFCIRYTIKGEFKKFLILIILMSTIHKSALIFIPVYFFVRLKPFSKMTGIVLGVSSVVLLFFEQMSGLISVILAGTQYAQYNEYIYKAGGGANILRVLVVAVPVVLSFYGRKKIEEENDPVINICVNYSILALTVYILSLQNWVFARFDVYFSLYSLILIPWVIHKLFKSAERNLVYFLCLLAYFVFYYYDSVITMHITYQSNFLGI